MPVGAAVRSSTLLMKRALRRLESPLVSKRWLVLEAIVCLAPTLLAALGCSVATLHWLVISIFFDAGVPLSTYVVSVYGVGATLGIIAVWIMLATRFGADASRGTIRLARIGFATGLLVALVIPEGASPRERISYFEIFREVGLFVLPIACYAHVIYLSRTRLLSSSKILRAKD